MRGGNQDFAKEEELKMENHFCDVILMTYFRWCNLMTS